MIVLSTATSVKVLKAIGQVPLRLFPGHTDIGNADLDKYTKGNAAKALFTECLSVVGSKELTPAQKSKAKKAKKKNDELNKSYRVIEKQNKKLSENDIMIQDQTDLIKELAAKIEKLEAEIVPIATLEKPEESVKNKKDIFKKAK